MKKSQCCEKLFCCENEVHTRTFFFFLVCYDFIFAHIFYYGFFSLICLLLKFFFLTILQLELRIFFLERWLYSGECILFLGYSWHRVVYFAYFRLTLFLFMCGPNTPSYQTSWCLTIINMHNDIRSEIFFFSFIRHFFHAVFIKCVRAYFMGVVFPII